METFITSDLIRGHTDSIILAILKESDSYVYEMYKKVLDLTDGEYELKEPTLYSSVRRLEKDGSITSYWGDETKGGRRKYYKITEHGEKLYKYNLTQWNYAKKMIEKLINTNNFREE